MSSVSSSSAQISQASKPLDLSVVLPAYNEAANLGPLVAEIDAALNGTAHEIIIVDDGSTDATRATLTELKAQFPQLRGLIHRKNAGQSRSLRSGIIAARADLIATLDSDGQNDPADIPALLTHITRADAPHNLAMIGGRRVKRRDTLAKRLASRVGNGVRKRLLSDEADDTGCGLKLFTREAFLSLPYFDHMHRYFPALMLREGYACEYVDVNHRPRAQGESKYTNFGRLRVSLSDLRGVRWLMSRSNNPQGWDEV